MALPACRSECGQNRLLAEPRHAILIRRPIAPTQACDTLRQRDAKGTTPAARQGESQGDGSRRVMRELKPAIGIVAGAKPSTTAFTKAVGIPGRTARTAEFAALNSNAKERSSAVLPQVVGNNLSIISFYFHPILVLAVPLAGPILILLVK